MSTSPSSQERDLSFAGVDAECGSLVIGRRRIDVNASFLSASWHEGRIVSNKRSSCACGVFDMPLYMDIHTIEGLTVEALAKAHAADVAMQGDYGVEYVKYWVNQDTGKVFCLC